MLANMTPLQMAERHLREAQGRFAKQLELVRQLTAEGRSIAPAVDLLGLFHLTLRAHQNEVDRLRRKPPTHVDVIHDGLRRR